MNKPYVDHVAIRTGNFEWYVDFFQNILGMEITLIDPEAANRFNSASWSQVWIGGIQLQRDETYKTSPQHTDQMTHIGIALHGVDAVLEKVYSTKGIVQAPGKPRNWFVMPEGPVIELVEAD